MDKIKQNPFLAAMAGAGVVLLILAGALLYPAWSSKSEYETKVKKMSAGLRSSAIGTPGVPDIESWNDGGLAASQKDEKDYAGKMTWSYKNIAMFYGEFDWNLEWWMTNGEVKPVSDKAEDVERFRQTPSRGSIEEKIRDSVTGPEGLAAKLKKRGVSLGLGEESEDNAAPKLGFNLESDINWSLIGADEPAVLKTLQKRYWIRERITNACIDKDIKVHRLVDVFFFRPLHEKLSPTRSGGDELVYAGVQPSKFAEYDLPGDLGKTITFGVTVELMYSEVPKFVQRMLDRDLAPRLLVNVIGMRMIVTDQNKLEDSETYEVYKPDDGKNEQRKKEAEARLNSRGGSPKPVRLLLTCQVVDFDPGKLPEWVRPLLPEWAKGPAPKAAP